MSEHLKKGDVEARERQEWLDSLKVGDKVYDSRPRGIGNVLAITRMTPTLFVLGEGRMETRARRTDGRFQGDSWGRIQPVTTEVLNKIRIYRNRERLGRITFHLFDSRTVLDDEQIQVMIEALDALDVSRGTSRPAE